METLSNIHIIPAIFFALWVVIGRAARNGRGFSEFIAGRNLINTNEIHRRAILRSYNVIRVLMIDVISSLQRTKTTPFFLVPTVLATVISANLTFGMINKIYYLGMVYIILSIFIPVYWFITAKIFTIKTRRFNDCITLGDIMKKLYGIEGLWLSNAVFLLMGIAMLVTQIFALQRLCDLVFGPSLFYNAVVIMAIVILYSTSGIKAVIMTDFYQFILIIITLLIIVGYCLFDLGSVDNFISRLPLRHKTLDMSIENCMLILSTVVFRLMPITEYPYVQRYLLTEDSKQLKQIFAGTAIMYTIFVILTYTIGLIIAAYNPNLASHQLFGFFMSNCVPKYLQGLVIAAIFAIILSTIDSWLNSTVMVVAHDIYPNFRPKLQEQVYVIIISTIVIGVISTILAFSITPTIEIIWGIHNIWDPIMVIPICAGYMGFRTAPITYIISSIIAIIGVMIGMLYAGKFGTTSLAFGVIFDAIGFFGIHYLYIKYKRPELIPPPLPNVPLPDYKKKAKIKRETEEFMKTYDQNKI